MKSAISKLVHGYESGGLTRRQLVVQLAGLVTAAAATSGEAASAQESGSTFQATSLNHIALHVSDVERSRDFYIQHLGLEVSSERLPNQCFLDCGPHFVALFRSSKPGLAHYCYSIPDYNQSDAAKRLRAVDLEPSLQGGRIYFDDPDRLVVQLASERHRA